ncbi:MAG: PQQ-dependent catabolism-associated CXXCW motif protein [Rhizobiales bacterium]|nr:PQQ-dependent catabolism-associated CXXCW motif protein [Hyphomicrobiales bacterium]
MHRPVHIVILLMAMAQSSPVSAQALDVDEPSGYRMKAFRADVPDTLTGATVVDTRQAEKLWRQGSTVFLDVLPRPVKPNNLPKGTVWRDKKRETIPGSFWLPNVGYGRLHPTMHDYFKNHLERLTQNDLTRPVLFYCLDRCWMSWNAAKRALEYGYSHVYWYPKGTDGWSLDGLPLEEKLPEE